MGTNAESEGGRHWAQSHHHPFGNNPKVQWQPHQCTLNHPGRTRVAIFRYFPGQSQNFPDTSKCTRSVPVRALRLRRKRDQMCWTWVNLVSCFFVWEKYMKLELWIWKCIRRIKWWGPKAPLGYTVLSHRQGLVLPGDILQLTEILIRCRGDVCQTRR